MAYFGLNMIEICITEADAPITFTWAKQVDLTTGVVGGSTEVLTNYLQKKYNYKLIDLAPKSNFLVIGAWLEECIGFMATDLIYEFEAEQVTIDLARTITRYETKRWPTKRTLTTKRKEEILYEYHPMVKNHEKLELRF